ncbi:MAG TPA: TadE/TadG family type IV pilus assembly protein [Dehalococcoidia bacterium]|nr:TadE/TadG family type IV pilus assembly protein [Dehalococcoidia bacterium]
MFASRSRRRRNERGQALVEFGLVSVVFFLLLFGIFDMARLFESWMSVQHASREAARYAITGQASCDGISDTPGDRLACIEQKGKAATTGLIDGGQSGTGVTVTYKAWDYIISGSTATWSATSVANKAGKECDQVEVKVSYTHHFMTPIVQVFAPSGINIHGSQKMTNEPFGPCSTGVGGAGDGVG